MDLFHYKILGTTSYWWFDAKDCLVKHFIIGEHVLDIGANIAVNFGDYVLDINPEALAISRCKFKKLWDLNNLPLPYPDDFFDTVILSDVIEHMENDVEILKEMHRILKNGGRVIITVPAFSFLYSEYDKSLGHKKRYNQEDILKIINTFQIKILTFWNFFLFIPMAFLRKINRGFAKSLPYVMDRILYELLMFENYIIKRGGAFPVGTTLLVVISKK